MLMEYNNKAIEKIKRSFRVIKIVCSIVGILICMFLASTGVGAVIGIPIFWCLSKILLRSINKTSSKLK